MIQRDVIQLREEKSLTDKIFSEIRNGTYSLHDSFLNELRIDYTARKIVFFVNLILEEGRSIRIELNGVSQLKSDITLDPKNAEIILDFDFNQEDLLDLYTTSLSSLQCKFQTIDIAWSE